MAGVADSGRRPSELPVDQTSDGGRLRAAIQRRATLKAMSLGKVEEQQQVLSRFRNSLNEMQRLFEESNHKESVSRMFTLFEEMSTSME